MKPIILLVALSVGIVNAKDNKPKEKEFELKPGEIAEITFPRMNRTVRIGLLPGSKRNLTQTKLVEIVKAGDSLCTKANLGFIAQIALGTDEDGYYVIAANCDKGALIRDGELLKGA